MGTVGVSKALERGGENVSFCGIDRQNISASRPHRRPSTGCVAGDPAPRAKDSGERGRWHQAFGYAEHAIWAIEEFR